MTFLIDFDFFGSILTILKNFYSFNLHFHQILINKKIESGTNFDILIKNRLILINTQHRHLNGIRFQRQILNRTDFVFQNWNTNLNWLLQFNSGA